MRDQLEHLAEHADSPRTVVQVIPFAAGEHTGLEMPFTVLSFPGDDDPDVVYLEQFTTASYVEDEYDVKRYTTMFDRLRASALDPDGTRAFIRKVAEEMS
jgi:hypothetical protein